MCLVCIAICSGVSFENKDGMLEEQSDSDAGCQNGHWLCTGRICRINSQAGQRGRPGACFGAVKAIKIQNHMIRGYVEMPGSKIVNQGPSFLRCRRVAVVE